MSTEGGKCCWHLGLCLRSMSVFLRSIVLIYMDWAQITVFKLVRLSAPTLM